MKKLFESACAGVFVLMFCAAVNAQNSSSAQKFVTRPAKTAVIIVGQTAKVGYEIAKFTTKEIVAPAASATLKPIIFKLAPKITLFFLKQTGNAVEKAVPIGQKLLITYLKTRIPL